MQRTLRALVVFVVLLSARTAGAAPSWVNNLPLWQWYSIPNTALSSVAPSPVPCGASGPSAKIGAWNGAALKRQGSVYLIGDAGGHADYCGNEVNALQLNTETPQWVQLIAPSPDSQVIDQAQYYLDLRPAATHTYYATQFINARNKLLIMPSRGLGMAGLPTPPPGWQFPVDAGYTFSFDLTTNTWDAPGTIARNTTVTSGDFTSALVAKHPVTEDVYYNRYASGWWRWTQATNTWTQLSNNNNGNYAGAAIDPVRNRMLIVGSYGGDTAPRVRDLNGNLLSVNFTGLGAGALTVGGYVGVVYDELNDKFLVVYNSGSGIRIYRVDPETWFVDQPAVSGTVPADRGNGIHNSAQYVPELGGIVIANSYTGNVQFMRTSSSGSTITPPVTTDTTAPSIPTGLTATAFSQSQINLSWNPSTDNVGVTGYRVYRGGVQISTVNSTSYQDSNLTASTTYSYTVAAYDAAGNLSTQSSTTAATTATTTTTTPSSTLLVKFGAMSTLNSFGLSGWSTVIKDAYTDYQNIGPGGTTIVIGDNLTYNYQGVSGTPRNFLAGEKIRVTWYNNSGSAATFTPNISFNDPDRIMMGVTGTWYPMTTVTVPSFGSAVAEYTLTSATAGTYSLVNVNVNYINTMTIIADKLELVGAGATTSQFDYSLATGGNQSVTQGQSASNTVTATLLSGPTQAIGFSVSGLPSATTATLSQTSCTPTCSTAINISTSSTTPTGNYTVNVTAVAGSVTKITSFTLLVNAPGTPPQVTGTLPVGTLAHDGPATPEQISLFLPVTGSLPQTATATVRYKQSSFSTWITGHPLFRIQPALSAVPNVGSVPDAFAWPIIDLTPGTSYDVEVSVTSGGITDVRTASFTTRSLPPAAGVPNKTITAGSSSSTIQAAFNSLNPGDVIQFQNGTYNLNGLSLDRSGTLNSPIVIRGQSRAGVVLSAPAGRVLYMLNASNVILENLTLQGSGVDTGSPNSVGIQFYDGSPTQDHVTVRNVTMNGVDVGIKAYHEITSFLAYDNTLTGNNVWTSSFIDTNITWDDDGINVPGFGNCVFNNTLRGFGDSFSVDTQQLTTDSVGIHFYRNDVKMGGDDGFEADGGHRNISFYDNRLENTMSFLSLDPLFGGPLLFARNISINVGRTPFKWNSQNSGQFIYNNTIVETEKKGGNDTSGWYQPNNGEQRSYGFRNNILIFRGPAARYTPWLESGGHDPIDWTNNSWFPNTGIQWSGVWANLAAAQAGIASTTPIFSGATKRLTNDNITVSDPFVTPIALGANYYTEITTAYTPILANSTAPKNSGVAIPNITDGFSGAAPDRGAIISGKSIPQYGDRGTTPPPAAPPVAPTSLIVQ